MVAPNRLPLPFLPDPPSQSFHPSYHCLAPHNQLAPYHLLFLLPLPLLSLLVTLSPQFLQAPQSPPVILQFLLLSLSSCVRPYHIAFYHLFGQISSQLSLFFWIELSYQNFSTQKSPFRSQCRGRHCTVLQTSILL